MGAILFEMSKKQMLVALVQTDVLAAVAGGGTALSQAIIVVAWALRAKEELIPDNVGEMVKEAIDIHRYATEEGRPKPNSLGL